MPFLIAGGGLLILAVILEGAIAGMHFVSIRELHEHTTVPIVVHLIAYTATIICLIPAIVDVARALRRRQPHWMVLVVIAVGTAVAIGRVMLGATAALLFLLGSVLWRKRP